MQQNRLVRFTSTLALCATLLAPNAAHAVGIFDASYNPAVIFNDGPASGTTMTVAFDGTHYWSGNGGYNNSAEYEYDASGNLIASLTPGLDQRSLFTDSAGNLYARQYADSAIYKQGAPGVFSNTGVSLTGGNLDAQAAVVLNGAGNEYVALDNGVIDRWALDGSYIGGVTLNGFGATGEASYPQGRGLAAVGSYYLTYNLDQTLSAWDASGNRVGTTTLIGAGTSFDSGFSLSYTNGLAFVNDFGGGKWVGYDVGFGGDGQNVPEPGSLAMLFGGGIPGLALLRRIKRKA